jgi:hypothetical protein
MHFEAAVADDDNDEQYESWSQDAVVGPFGGTVCWNVAFRTQHG